MSEGAGAETKKVGGPSNAVHGSHVGGRAKERKGRAASQTAAGERHCRTWAALSHARWTISLFAALSSSSTWTKGTRREREGCWRPTEREEPPSGFRTRTLAAGAQRQVAPTFSEAVAVPSSAGPAGALAALLAGAAGAGVGGTTGAVSATKAGSAAGGQCSLRVRTKSIGAFL